MWLKLVWQGRRITKLVLDVERVVGGVHVPPVLRKQLDILDAVDRDLAADENGAIGSVQNKLGMNKSCQRFTGASVII